MNPRKNLDDEIFSTEANDGDILDSVKYIWAESGDMLSKQYSGTGSTIATVTKNGRQGFLGKLTQKMISVERFIRNNL